MKYKGVHICESLSSRQRVQGYLVKRIPVDDFPLHLNPPMFVTEQEAKKWIDNEYDPRNVGHDLTKPDERPYVLK